MTYEYVGAIHIHSTYSDGTGSIPEIARFAGEVGLDFIMMSDHNTLKPKRDGYERWYDSVQVLIGYEINDKQDKNHYLAFGLDSTVGVRITAQEYVRRVKERGGVGFIAHPDECRNKMPQHPPYPWLAWDSEDFDGIEIWNHMSEWVEGLTEENKFNRFIHPLRSIVAPPKITLDRWDALNLTRRVVGIGGVDAHAHKSSMMGFFDVEVFPYKVMFKSIHTHVLLETPIRTASDKHFQEDKTKIYEALRAGNSFIANSYHADARGFRFYAQSAEGIHPSGSYVDAEQESLTLNVHAPQKAQIKLLRNGEVVEEIIGTDIIRKTTLPGAYRVEVWLEGKAWIYSNHIRVGVGKKN